MKKYLLFLFCTITHTFLVAQSLNYSDLGVIIHPLNSSEQVVEAAQGAYIMHDGSTNMTAIFLYKNPSLKKFKRDFRDGKAGSLKFTVIKEVTEGDVVGGIVYVDGYKPATVLSVINDYGVGITIVNTSFLAENSVNNIYELTSEKVLEVLKKMEFSQPKVIEEYHYNNSSSTYNTQQNTVEQVPKYNPCVTCIGSGRRQCSNCNGVGIKYVNESYYNNYTERYDTRLTSQVCTQCSGVGKHTCNICGGTGKN